MRTQREVRAFVEAYMGKVQLPVPLVLFYPKNAKAFASSDPVDYVINIYGTPVSKTILKHEMHHLALALYFAAERALEDIVRLADRGAR